MLYIQIKYILMNCLPCRLQLEVLSIETGIRRIPPTSLIPIRYILCGGFCFNSIS